MQGEYSAEFKSLVLHQTHIGKVKMKSFEDLKTVVESSNVYADAQAVATEMQQQISRLLPDFYRVDVRYTERLGKSISILVFDTRKESISVTWHNSDNIAHFLMHLSDGSGRDLKTITKVSFEKMHSSYFPEGVKYRKISAPSIEAAGKKMTAWFKKHAQAFADAPANR